MLEAPKVDRVVHISWAGKDPATSGQGRDHETDSRKRLAVSDPHMQCSFLQNSLNGRVAVLAED